MVAADTHNADWLQLTRTGHPETAGLCLTKPRLQALYGTDLATSEALLAAHVAVKLSRCPRQKACVRADRA